MATTPQEWLPVLAKRMDERMPRIKRLRSYQDGKAPMPEMGRNVRASWERFQKKARTNTGGLVVEALAERVLPSSILVGDKIDSQGATAARRYWRDIRRDVAFSDAIRDMFGVSVGYLVAGQEDDGQAMITSERPEQMIAAVNPLRPWQARAALKVWRDLDDGFDYAYVWVQDQRQQFRRPSKSSNALGGGQEKLISQISGNWSTYGQPEEYTGKPPVVVLENYNEQAEFEAHTDLIDRINLGILQRLVTVSMQAYRQRALKRKGQEGGYPDDDEEGSDVDWAKVFEPAPGALWDLPDDVDIWESQQTDITPMLSAVKDDYRDLCAVTRTPISVLVPDSANQSAEGASFAREGLVLKARDRINRVSSPLAVIIVHALRIEGIDLGTDTVKVQFESPATVSMSEKYAAAAQAKSAGLAVKTIQRQVLGMTEDEINADSAARTEEQLALMATLEQDAPTGSGPQAATGPESAAETKARADALGVLIRAGMDQAEAATRVGLGGATFTGVPVAVRLSEAAAGNLEDA
ncbi:phage portal protein [Arthrobacter rhombi]|uniref:phage portal protein n=1 Tax=Arthrobacter rhombi TaxID=71253 RepID=UPI003FD12D1A